MEKSSFAMAKFGLEAKEAMPKRDCGFYVKYIFLFTSLIQFLIILGLVLFMVYGNAQAGTDTHLRLLEAQVQGLYNKTLILSGRNMNLTRTLNATLKEKQGLQVLSQKVQRDLEKCNSTQAANPISKVRIHPPPASVLPSTDPTHG
ncbi:plasmalemma vesicle-associated protein [Limosa lapponica baueri]|uniref:Plasmalemma vesicle-associated protein n=1 Tax=Limosa lapponica baueri TaxID=1758121 RepID=A0A2I0SZP3_LIMLA|nr:plasmalemma vesicle-associated protein [Limosa lapponica baueri]